MITAAWAAAARKPVPRPAADPTVAQTPPQRLTYDERLAGADLLLVIRRRYPGPAGEVLSEAVAAYLDFGFRTDPASAVPRLIRELTPR